MQKPNTDMHHNTSIGFGNLGAAATAPLSCNSILLIFTTYQGKRPEKTALFLLTIFPKMLDF